MSRDRWRRVATTDPASTIIPIRMANPVAIRTAPSIDSSKVFTCATTSDDADCADHRQLGRSAAVRSAAVDRAVRRGDGRHQRVGRGLERAGREDDGEVEAKAAPVDLPQRGDPRLDRPAEDGDGQRVADLETERRGGIDVDADQGRAAIVLGPPLAGDDPVGGRQVAGEGQPAVAAQDPGAFGNVASCRSTRTPLTAVTGPRSDGTRRSSAPGRLGRGERAELRAPRRAGYRPGTGPGRVSGSIVSISARMLDAVAGQRHQQRQAEAERHRQPPGGGARPVERGDAEAGDRAAEMLRPACDAPDGEANQCEQAAEDGNSRRAHRRRTRDRWRCRWRSPPPVASASGGQDEGPPAERLAIADIAAQQSGGAGVAGIGDHPPAGGES